jgi:L-fuconolactonase
MKRIDSHQHFWKFDPVRDAWITEDMKKLQRDFMPQDLQPILEENGVEGCVAVQADQSLTETLFLLDLAEDYLFIKGVVGWVDLQSDQLEKQLDHFSEEEKLKGFRHIVQAEQDPEFLNRPSFLSGIKKLRERDYTYDLLITSNQLPQAVNFARNIPDDLPVVIDHLAKPNLLEREFDLWASQMKVLAEHPNFYCKLSGLVTEARWDHWEVEDFEPYIDYVVTCFGAERVFFGSDWPVSNLSATYDQVIDVVDHYLKRLSENEQELIWHRNAETFYKL